MIGPTIRSGSWAATFRPNRGAAGMRGQPTFPGSTKAQRIATSMAVEMAFSRE